MIYFVQGAVTRRIKIGFSNDPVRRLTQLQNASPDELILLGIMRGQQDVEEALHNRFRPAHFRMEWFEPVQPLLDYIAENAHPCPVPVPPKQIVIQRQEVSLPVGCIEVQPDGSYKALRHTRRGIRAALKGNPFALFECLDRLAGDKAYCLESNSRIAEELGKASDAIAIAVSALENPMDSPPLVARVYMGGHNGTERLGIVLWQRSQPCLPDACSSDRLHDAIAGLMAHRQRLRSSNPYPWLAKAIRPPYKRNAKRADDSILFNDEHANN